MPERDTAESATQSNPGSAHVPQRDEGIDGYPKTPNRFITWVSNQSVPRLLGLLFGNTRELEIALVKTEVEIVRVRREAETEIKRLRDENKEREAFWQSGFRELSDSVLLSKGLLPLSRDARDLVSSQSGSKVVEPKNSVKQMELEIEADKLLEMLQHGDYAALQNRIEDMLQSNQPKDKRILQLYAQREAALQVFEREAEIGMGVVVGVPSEMTRVS